MKQFRTNFELIFELSGMSGPQFIKLADASRSQLAVWKNGSRKIVKGSRWAKKIASVFLAYDETQPRPFLAALLSEVYPPDHSKDSVALRLEWFLTAEGQENQAKKRAELYVRYFAYLTGQSTDVQVPAQEAMEQPAVVGYYESRRVLSGLVDYVAAMDKTAEIIFVCPDGIDIITKDEAFGIDMLSRMAKMLEKGNTLDVVLRTDFKLSEVSAFSGPWLVAHLMGLIKSWYYDDFRLIETDHILVCVKDVIAVRISGDEYRCEIFRDPPMIQKLYKKCLGYKRHSVQHFHYNLFENPDGFLLDVPKPAGAASYLFQRLPHFGIGGQELPRKLGLSDVETNYVLEQFMPMFLPPAKLAEDGPVYHMFCIDDIEDALDKPRHMCAELQEMLGKRIYMNTQTMIDLLVAVKKTAEAYKNYVPCFLPARVFDSMRMEIGIFGKALAVGWIPGKQSTATREYATVAALHGFCSTIWSRVPRIAKSKSAAARALGKLLNRAAKMGYEI